MEPKDVFVTGATGFVGQAVAGRLAAAGHRVTALLLPQEDARTAPGCRVVRGDITRPETLAGRIAHHDAVVHLAGAVGYGQAWDTCVRLNREGTRNVADEALRCGVRRFVHMSSVSVYGRVSGVPIREDAPLRKIGDPYGDTKIDSERLLEERARTRGLELTVVRPTVIYGPGDRLFLPKVIENLRSGGARVIGPGTNRVDLVHVGDVAEFVCRVLQAPGTRGRAYNLTHPDNPTWQAFLAEVASLLHVPVPEKHLPYRAALAVAGVMEAASFFTGKPPRLTRYAVRNVGRPYLYSTDRMREELGFQPAVETLEGIRACVLALRAPGPAARRGPP